jgi:WD40 repeat protein
MKLNRLILKIAILLIGIAWHTSVIAQQGNLPSEATLPGQERPVKPVNDDELPDEATLPGTRSPAKPVELTQPIVEVPKAQEADLPAESELPATADVVRHPDEVAAADEFQGAKVGEGILFAQDKLRDAENRPWLRLLVGGPTGPLRAITFSRDSQRIMAGGRDKALHIWQRDAAADPLAAWSYEKPLYWQVQRGESGAIRAIAATGRFAAFAGTGASASNGEIALVDTETFRLQRLLYDLKQGHRADISALAIGKDARLLASLDIEGHLVAWMLDAETGKWNSRVVRKNDEEILGRQLAGELMRWRVSGNAMAATDEDIFYPELISGFQSGKVPRWQLARWNLKTAKTDLLPLPLVNGTAWNHGGSIVAVACSQDGDRVVSADLADNANIFCWDFKKQSPVATFRAAAPIRSMTLSPSGRLLVAGTDQLNEEPSLKIWQWEANATPRLIGELPQAGPVTSCAISPDEKRIAFTIGNAVHVISTDAISNAPLVLKSKQLVPQSVAFSADKDDYRFAFDGQAAHGDAAQLHWVFDPVRLSLQVIEADDKTNWIAANPQPDRWQLVKRLDQSSGEVRWELVIAGQVLGALPLDVALDGNVTCASWIADAEHPLEPAAIVVGTSGRNQLYLFRLNQAEKSCKLVRQYRGHEASVLAVGCSADRRFLVSAAHDGTVRLWKLDQAWQEDESTTMLLQKWGVSLEVRDDQLLVTEAIPDGPLYFRGIRSGDVITRLTWVGDAENGLDSADNPAVMLRELTDAPRQRLCGFESSRAGLQRSLFYLYPAWQPLVSLVTTVEREWAWWTPYGYYDASFNGHKIFGWQVNRGVEQAPDAFRASELQQEFERPEVMERLLLKGNLQDAFSSLHLEVPLNVSQRLTVADRLRPLVEITEPAADELLGERVALKATISVPLGVELVPPKAFANGVPAIHRRQTGVRSEAGFAKHDFVWDLRLPDDPQIRLQVFASTVRRHAGFAEISRQRRLPDASVPRRIWLVSAGVNRYADSRVPQLDFAVNNAQKISRLWQNALVEVTLLTDENVNPPLWRLTLDALARQLRESAEPNDLVIIFLSGHGVLDQQSQQYYYLGSSARFNDVLGRRFTDCLSIDDISAFGDVPCKKLLILDTCHSGAIQPLLQRNLKSIVRTLENDLFFTLTASEGAQEAFESPRDQMGVFTRRLIEVLAPNPVAVADGLPSDRAREVKSLAEVLDYLRATVPRDAAGADTYQYPTAAPDELLEFLLIPGSTRR